MTTSARPRRPEFRSSIGAVRRRRRLAAIAVTGSLALVACGSGGDDDTDDATTVAPATEAPTTEAPETTAAPTTEAPTTVESTAPETTEAPETTAAPTTEAPTTTVDPLAEARAAVEAVAGDYTGTWTNTTFGSTGPMTMSIALDGDDVVVDVDLDGFVFGQSDPDAENYRIPLSSIGGSEPIETGVFGPATTTIDDATGTITLLADAVPAPGIVTFEATVTPTGDGAFEGTYVVTFDAGDTAEGVFDYTRG